MRFFGSHHCALQPTMPCPITTGALVVVKPCQKVGKRDSEGGCGVVIKKKQQKKNDDDDAVKILTQTLTVLTSGNSLFDIKYTMGGFSQDVEKERVSIATLATKACRRTPTDEMQPSLMSPNHQLTMTMTTTTTTATTTATTQYLTPYSYKYLMKSANKQ